MTCEREEWVKRRGLHRPRSDEEQKACVLRSTEQWRESLRQILEMTEEGQSSLRRQVPTTRPAFRYRVALKAVLARIVRIASLF